MSYFNWFFRDNERRVENKETCIGKEKIIEHKENIKNCIIYYNYFNNKSKSWMWDIAGDTIINNVKAKASVAFIPKECDDGEEYMGKHYILERVDLLNDDN